MPASANGTWWSRWWTWRRSWILGTVAEGVEEPGQAARLRAINCDMLQGYVFSRPVPVAEFEQMLFGA